MWSSQQLLWWVFYVSSQQLLWWVFYVKQSTVIMMSILCKQSTVIMMSILCEAVNSYYDEYSMWSSQQLLWWVFYVSSQQLLWWVFYVSSQQLLWWVFYVKQSTVIMMSILCEAVEKKIVNIFTTDGWPKNKTLWSLESQEHFTKMAIMAFNQNVLLGKPFFVGHNSNFWLLQILLKKNKKIKKTQDMVKNLWILKLF